VVGAIPTFSPSQPLVRRDSSEEVVDDRSPAAGEPQEYEPLPGSEHGRPLTDDEVRVLGYSHCDRDGRWVGLDRLTPSERATCNRQAARARDALENPTRVTNPDAMFDAVRDAMWNRPTIGALRRGVHVVPEPEPFDWTALRRRADEEHAQAIADVLNPRREVPRPEAIDRGPGQLEVVDAAKGPAYAARALEGEAEAVATAPVGLRAITLNTSAWTLARPELDELVDADDIEAALVPAAVDAGLSEREARSIVRGALRRRGRR
jgi:hypothetical protein